MNENSLDEMLKLAEQGYPDAMWNVFVLYRDESKDEEAIRWLVKSAEANFGMAQYELGTRFALGRFGNINHQEAFYWYTQGAKNQHIESTERVGSSYIQALGVERDVQKGRECLVIAAKHGYPRAMFNLALSYGNDEPKDLDEWFYWIDRASARGYPLACRALAHFYQHGNFELEINHQRAFELLTDASTNAGCPIAQHELALLYANGIGTPSDLELSYLFAQISISNPRATEDTKSSATHILDQISTHIPEERKFDLDQTARQFRPNDKQKIMNLMTDETTVHYTLWGDRVLD